MSEHGGHEQYEIDDTSDMVDHVSNLPDCLLHYILSFMPTKEAVKTSIISTRWRNLWASVPNIDIEDEFLYTEKFYTEEVDNEKSDDVTSFVNIVETVLRLRDASNIKMFSISGRIYGDPSIINSWISYAIRHNVQELDLYFFTTSPSVLPQCMFENTSLVSLKIRRDWWFELPSHVSIPCLKTLHLWFLLLPNNGFIENLFSGCPILEELCLFECIWKNLNNVAISSSTLKSIIIEDMSSYRKSSDCKIKIDAANLTYFEYYGRLSNKIILNNTSPLFEAFVIIPSYGEATNELACKVIDLLKQLQYVVSLRLVNFTLETLSFADDKRFPVFPNLTHLMLSMEIGMNSTLRVLMDLFSFCPVLQSISFSEGLMRGMHLGENNSIWSSIPTCISNSLKTVRLKNFHGYKSEIRFLKCVLKYACVLERMDIWWSETCLLGLKRRTRVMKGLENFEREATACVINFS